MTEHNRHSSGLNGDLPNLEVIRRLAISASGFVFDPVSGLSFIVNETGRTVLQRLQNEQRLEQILEFLELDYASTPLEIERDVLDFLEVLRKELGGV